MIKDGVFHDAFLSADGVYRYCLRRIWSEVPWVVWLMLNPSTADALKDDATIRRCIGFARAWGFGGICVVNLYGFRTAYPTVLTDAARVMDVVGPETSRVYGEVLREDRLVIAAWGAAPWAQARGQQVMAAYPHVDFHCLRRTKSGAPEHPVRLPKDLRPQVYRARLEAA